jgi:aspartokinase
MKKFLIGKIGGAGLMMLFEKLFDWVKYVVKDIEPGTQIIIVVSAFATVTKKLQKIFELKLNGETTEAMLILDSIKNIHLQRCTDLLIRDTTILYGYFHEIEYFILKGSINEKNLSISNAHLLKFGELMSSEIFNQFLLGMRLSVKLIDAQQMIFATGDDYCNSIPLESKTSVSIANAVRGVNSQIILTQGYISNHGVLGLDGSDLTASLIACGLKSSNLDCYAKAAFWKDVKGVLVNGVVKKEMSGDEYASLETGPVRFDAIATNVANQVETEIRPFDDLENEGTKITW